MDAMCIALVVFICVGMLAAVLVMAIVNQTALLARNLNPFSREVVVR